jgi:hypothetical protein
LPDQKDLNQLRFLGLEVRQHPDFLQRRHDEVLRFVDDEEREAPAVALVDEEPGQIADQERLGRVWPRLEAEVEHDGLQQLERVEHRVHQPRDRRLLVERPEHRLQHRRLAAADLAGDDDEAGLAFDAVAQVAERLLVDAARVQITGIGRQ